VEGIPGYRSGDGLGSSGGTTYGPLSSKAAQTKTVGVVVHPLKWLTFII